MNTVKTYLKRLSKVFPFFLATVILLVGFNVNIQALTESKQNDLRAILYKIVTADNYNPVDISSFGVTYIELNKIWEDMIKNEGYIAHQSHASAFLQTTKNSNGTIKNVWLYDLDGGTGFTARYNNVKTSVNEIVSSISSDMTEIEKVLLVHEYIVSNTYYSISGYITYMGGGPLGLGYGVCQGYSNAMILALKEIGIESKMVSSNAMNHAWVLVKIDGEWYHIDSTWDDTKNNNSGKGNDTLHRFFVKNSNEFMKDSTYPHYNWAPTDESTSTKYSNWFVHNVKGLMYRDESYWYYIDPNSSAIVRSKIDGSEYKEVVSKSGIGSLALLDVKNGIVYYSADGVKKTKDVKALVNTKLAVLPEPNMLSNSNSPTSSVPTNTWTVNNLNYNSFSNWRTGNYDWTNGQYTALAGRICLNDYINCKANDTITVSINNGSYNVLIRELDANKKMIISRNLTNNSSFVTSPLAQYLAVSIFNPTNSTVSLTTYQQLFVNGLSVGLKSLLEENAEDIQAAQDNSSIVEIVQDINVSNNNLELPITSETSVQEELSLADNGTNVDDTASATDIPSEPFIENTVQSVDKNTDVLDTNLSDINIWKSGNYHYITGKFVTDVSRIGLNDLVKCEANRTYKVALSNTSYNILIRTYNSNEVMIGSSNLKSGSTITTSQDACYFGISIYNPSSSSLTFDDYKNLFAQGLTIEIQ